MPSPTGGEMATFEERPTLNMEVVLRLSEAEAMALWALGCYGTDAFLKIFYKEMGEAYLKPHEDGLRSLFGATGGIENIAHNARKAREVFTGQKIAVTPKKDAPQ